LQTTNCQLSTDAKLAAKRQIFLCGKKKPNRSQYEQDMADRSQIFEFRERSNPPLTRSQPTTRKEKKNNKSINKTIKSWRLHAL